ncbi:hypothetical protein PInf_011832 [Phytophthora infestans]|nr:hypothetical protein PInf_011832 [Phytophthora infestans]
MSGSGTDEDVRRNNLDDSGQGDVDPGKSELQQITSREAGYSEEKSVDSTDKDIDVSPGTTVEEAGDNVKQAESAEKRVSGEEVGNQAEGFRKAYDHDTQKTYEDDEFDDNDDGTNDNAKETGSVGEYNVWNLDPSPQNKNNNVELDQRTDSNGEDITNPGIWNADPNPAAATEADIPSEVVVNKEVWNLDPREGRSDEPIDDVSVHSDDEVRAHDDSVHFDEFSKEKDAGGEYNAWNVDPNPQSDHQSDRKNTEMSQQIGTNDEAVVWNQDPYAGGSDSFEDDAFSDEEDHVQDDPLEHAESISNEDRNTSNVWNLDPNSSAVTDAKLVDAATSHEVEVQSPANAVQEGESKVTEHSTDVNVWNLNPMPSSDPARAATKENNSDDTINEPVWNLNPEPVAEIISNPDDPGAHRDASEEPLGGNSGSSTNEIAKANLNPSYPVSTAEKEVGEHFWNLESTSASSGVGNKDDNKELVQFARTPLEDDAGVSEFSIGAGNAQVEPNLDAATTDADTSNDVWNLEPTAPAAASMINDDETNSPDGEEAIEDTVWNLDPHTGDASEPIHIADEVAHLESAQGDGDAPSPQMQEDPTPTHQEAPEITSNHPDPLETTEHTSEASYESSPRGSEDDEWYMVPIISSRNIPTTFVSQSLVRIMIACVAVIGAANSPLYIRTFGEEGEDLGFHYIAHVSLDVIEEKLRGAGITSSKDDMYLGFLGPIEDYRVYGYVTNTSVKFVVVLQDAPVRESELRPFFAEVHRLYVNAMSNPFAPLGERLTSQTFDKRVSNLVVQHNTGN